MLTVYRFPDVVLSVLALEEQGRYRQSQIHPHEAREDTVLFPAFRTIVTPHAYDALGEAFEQREHRLFGEDGFEQIVDRVAAIEKRLGLYDLA